MRILLVEDDCVVLKFEQILLNKLDHHVDGFQNPIEALKHFQASPFKYDVIITDLDMPAMSGDDLACQIKAVRPDIPVVLCSGDLIRNSDFGSAVDRLIHKPFSMSLMKDMIAELIGSATAPTSMAV